MDKPCRILIYIAEKDAALNQDDPNAWIIPANGTTHKFERINKKKKKYEVRVSVLDRLNNESELSQPVILKL